MTDDTGITPETLSDARRRRLRRQVHAAPLRHRLEPALLMVLGLAVFGLVVAALAAAIVETRNGYFDPPVVEPVPDRRILQNMRQPGRAPFVDAVLDDAGGALLALRKDGVVHRIHRRTELVADEDLRADGGTTGSVALASAGCGQVGGTTTPARDPCGLDGHVFATTDLGGLVLRQPDGDWHTLVGDAAWIGLDGMPVQDAQLVDWSVSDDRNWVLMSAGDQGLGLFDVSASAMVPVPANIQQLATAAPGGVTRLRFRQGRFWTGSGSGIASLGVTTGKIDLQPVLDGRVLDLEPDTGGGLLAIAATPCGASECLGVYRISGDGRVDRIMGEDEHHPALANSSLHYARQQAGLVVVLGSAGIFVYDPDTRGWRELARGDVTAYRADTDDTLHAAIGADVITIADGRVAKRQTMPQAPIVQIIRADASTRLAVADSGAVMQVETGAVLFAPAPTPYDPDQTVDAAAVGNRIFARTPSGILVHDIDKSRYAWVPQADLPAPLKAAGELVGADGRLWVVSRPQGWIALVHVDEQTGGLTLDASERLRFGQPLASVNATEDGLILVGADGVPHRITTGPDGPEATPLVGAARPQAGRFLALASDAKRLVASQGGEVLEYQYGARAWSLVRRFDPAAFRVTDVALGTSVYALGQNGRVQDLSGNAATALVGGGPVWPISSDAVSDARAHLGRIYVAGDGHVVSYAPQDGRITRIWRGGGGAIRLLDFDGFDPLWLSNGAAYLGGRRISLPSETIRTAWIEDQNVVLVRAETAATASLRITAIKRPDSDGKPPPDRCYFTRPAASGDRFFDAMDMGRGLVLTLTDAGPQLYDRRARRWLDVPGTPPGAEAVTPLGEGAILSRGNDLWWITGLTPRDACIADMADLTLTPMATRSFAVSPDGATLAMVAPDGSVRQASGATSVATVLGAPTPGPTPSALGRAFRDRTPGIVHFADPAGIWTYDSNRRQWHRTPLSGGPANPVAIDMVRMDSPAFAVTVRDDTGRARGGIFDPGALRPVKLTAVAQPFLTGFAQDSAAIIDVVQTDEFWFFLLRDRLLAYDIATGAPVGDLQLPADRETWDLRRQGDTLVLNDNGARWFLPPLPTSWAGPRLADAAYRADGAGDMQSAVLTDEPPALLRITDDGSVLHCRILWGQAMPTGCDRKTPPPLKVARADILDSFDFLGGTAILMPDGLYHLKPDLRRLEPFDNGQAIRAGARFLRVGGQVLALNPGGDLFAVTQTLAIRPLATGITQLINRPGLPNIARKDARFYRIDATGLSLMGPDDAKFQRFVTFEDTVASFRQDGVFVDADGLPLPDTTAFPYRASDLAAIADTYRADPQHGAQPGAWLQGGDGTVRYWAASRCTEPPENHGPPFLDDPFQPDGTCPRQMLRLDPPRRPNGTPERLLRVTPQGNGRVLRFDTRDVFVEPGQTTPAIRQRPGPVWPEPAFITSTVETVRAAVTRLGGHEVLYPPRLAEGPETLTLRLGRTTESANGHMTPKAMQPADKPWLRFDKENKAFELPLAGLSLPVADAARDGRFVWAAAGHWSYRGGDRWLKATDQGIITYLAGGAIVAELDRALRGTPQHLDQGRFILADGRMLTREQDAQQVPPTRTLGIDDLVITTDIASGRSGARVPVDGVMQPAMDANGFIFDHRDLVGWIGGEIYSGSQGVIGPTGRIADLTAMPGGAADALISTPTASIARSGNEFWQRDPDGRWTPTQDPHRNAELVQSAQLRWSLVDGRGDITPVAPDLTWRAARDGLQFRADRLIDATSSGGTVLAATGLGLHRLAGLNDLLVGADVDPAAPAAPQRVDHAVTGPGSALFWADTSGGRHLLNLANATWSRPANGAAPWQIRRPITGGPVEITIAGDTAAFARAVENLDGIGRRFAFQWAQGARFPFDDARSIFAQGDTLWVGTAAGLRELTRGAAPDSRLVALDRDATGRPGPVTTIGRPLSDPTAIHARSPVGCAVLSEPATRPACDPRTLDTRVVADTPLWVWRRSATGLSGRYRDATGQEFGPPVDMTRTRWPHDTLAIVTLCGGRMHEIWRDRDVARDNGALVDLTGAGIRHLHCIARPRPLGGGRTLPAALYATGGTALVNTGGWTQIAATDQADIGAIAQFPYYRDRLRLRRADRGPGVAVEHRGADDRWQPLGWTGGRLRIDTPGRMAHADGVLWRYAPQHFVRTTATADHLTLDPDGLEILRSDLLATCRPDAIASHDGTDGDWPARPGSPLSLRCADGRLASIDTNARAPAPAVAPLAADPFADRTLLDEPGLWSWRNTGATAGARGQLDITFRGEPAGLNGRFAFDAVRSLANVSPDRLDLVAGDGWWRSDAAAPVLRATRRPADTRIDATTVTDILPEPFVDGATLSGGLCLAGSERRAIQTANGAVSTAQTCTRWQGTDGFWTYVADDAGPTASGVAANGGTVRRTLHDGRFGDLFILAPPVGSASAPGTLFARSISGVTQLDLAGGVQGVLATGPRDLPLTDTDGRLHLLTASGLRTMPDDQGARPTCPGLRLPPDSETLASLSRTTDGDYEATVVAPGDRHRIRRSLVDCDTPGDPTPWAATATVADRLRLTMNRATWPDAAGAIGIWLRDGHLVAAAGPARVSHPMPAGSVPLRLLPDPRNGRFYVLTDGDLLRGDHDAILSSLNATPAPRNAGADDG